MKITAITTFRLPGASVVRVETDEKLRGFGETSSLTPADLAALKSALGKDPASYEVLRFQMQATPRAQAALNMALLDILGKKTRVPVYQLLGGPTRTKVRVMTALEGDGRGQTQTGHRALVVKVTPAAFPNPRFNFVRETGERLERLRAQLGENVDFVLDAGGGLPPGEAANLSARLEKFHLLWFDEPCPLANLGAVRKLARENVTPLGFGRTIEKIAAVPDLFREQAIDVLRLDIRLHGITQIRKMAALAETYYTAVAPFNDGGILATAAAVQLAASLPNFFIQQAPAQLSSSLFRGLGSPQEGYVALPSGPGLGIEVDERELGRYQEAA
jgi:galactonate dehydratase